MSLYETCGGHTKGSNNMDVRKLAQDTNLLARHFYSEHKKAFENWSFGEIKKVWFDADNNLCIEYESGDWFHYQHGTKWW